MRLKFTVSVEGAPNPTQIELRNGVIVISEVSAKGNAHIDVSSKEWAEFVVGQRSFADRAKVIAKFEGVLDRKTVPKGSETMDVQLDDVAEDVGYLCDGGEDH